MEASRTVADLASYNAASACQGIVKVVVSSEGGMKQDELPQRRDRVLPLVRSSVRRLGSEEPERRPRDEMALKVVVIVDGGMHDEEPLGGSS